MPNTAGALVVDDRGTGSSTFSLGVDQVPASISLSGVTTTTEALGGYALTIGHHGRSDDVRRKAPRHLIPLGGTPAIIPQLKDRYGPLIQRRLPSARRPMDERPIPSGARPARPNQ